MKIDRQALALWSIFFLALVAVGVLLVSDSALDPKVPPAATPQQDAPDGPTPTDGPAPADAQDAGKAPSPSQQQARPAEEPTDVVADPAPQLAPAARALPVQADGRVDFAALGLTGKEAGAELLQSEVAPRREPIRIAWSVGDAWEVDAYYRQMQAGDGQGWSQPSRWRFNVVRRDRFQGQGALVVTATLLHADGSPDPSFPTTTYYVADDAPVLLGADLYHVRAGKGKHLRVAYPVEGQASVAAGSIVPFELPPAGAEGRVRVGPSLPSLDGGPRGRETPGATLEVAFTSPADGVVIHQRWSPDESRWPLASETPTRRAYLRR